MPLVRLVGVIVGLEMSWICTFLYMYKGWGSVTKHAVSVSDVSLTAVLSDHPDSLSAILERCSCQF